MLKSESLNSYLMLNPKGPNFLLSWIIAWKNVSVKTSLCHYLFFVSHCLKNESDKSVKDFLRLAFNPLGGYSVSLLPF
jgi:hypothetical protein